LIDNLSAIGLEKLREGLGQGVSCQRSGKNSGQWSVASGQIPSEIRGMYYALICGEEEKAGGRLGLYFPARTRWFIIEITDDWALFTENLLRMAGETPAPRGDAGSRKKKRATSVESLRRRLKPAATEDGA
jgi:hypothetical protein